MQLIARQNKDVGSLSAYVLTKEFTEDTQKGIFKSG
jgi:hypothetical protein